MKFGEKVREARIDARLTQQEFADLIGVSLRTVTNYETGNRYPKKRSLYRKIAEVLHVDLNYLLTEDENYGPVVTTGQYGRVGSVQAREVLGQISAIFAGSELSEEDKDDLMQAIQEAYWIARKNHRKFGVHSLESSQMSVAVPEQEELPTGGMPGI